MRLRLLALIGLVALLSACNVALSDKPLFADGQRSPNLLLEDGIWTLEKPECAADLSKPRKDWASCVDWVIVGRNKALLGSDSKPGDGPQDILIVDGRPPLLQAKVTTSESPPSWAYLVFHPKAVSKAGRIISVDVWPVACGTQDPGGGANATIHPYPGFSEECRTSSVDALRAAASKDRAAGTEIVTWKWVRAETP